MVGLGGVMKGGWHPKGKDGKSTESWRGDFKGVNQVAGWMGKGKDSGSTEAAKDHVSVPISSLKDPSAFGPPPKNVNYHGGAALPNQLTPDRRGMGAPLTAAQINSKREEEEEQARLEEEEARRAAAPPVPYRADTTGLSTAHLPPPPGRKDGADGRSIVAAPKPKPGLPPRLPPRQNSQPSPGAASPPPTYGAATSEPAAHKGILNQGSLNRLGASGISVSGFGIGGKQPLPPPQTSPKPSSPAASGPQLSELQSRFSRLGTSSSTAEAPSSGTTFAQKQAALKTASSFRNDPSSVSLSDARTAASTANNFRERHGDQVAGGWKSANKLNQKYGIADKVGSYSTPSVGTPSSPAEQVTSPTIELRDNTLPFKKPPPPPPKKKAGLSGGADAGLGPPPPIPLSSKPKPNNLSHPEQMDLDLDLPSLWFAKTPAAFPPPSIANLPGSRSYASSSGWSSSGIRKTFTFTGVIRHNSNLGTTKIHLTWDGSNPGLTVKEQQRHIPPPRILSAREVDAYREQYSDQLARWCESKMGHQVGNGECWTLAADGLAAVAASCRSRNEEPCMTSQGVVHGSLVFSFLPPQPCSPAGGVEAAGVSRGDVIQFLSCHFKRKDGRGQSWAGAPDHTSVVTGVERGGVLRVVEQNVGGVKRVQEGKYDFSELVAGEVRIFRAVGESWVGRLEASWP